MIFKKLKNIILMHFRVKNNLKSNRNHISKQASNRKLHGDSFCLGNIRDGIEKFEAIGAEINLYQDYRERK
jgi:hypothetical protein